MDASHELNGAVVASRYRLDAPLKGGADSTKVFDATDLRDGGGVVVRLVKADTLSGASSGSGSDKNEAPDQTDAAVEAFKRNVFAVAGVSHPVLVSPLDWGDVVIGPTRYGFVVTERVGGTSLRELLDRGRRLTASQAVVMALDVCRALHHLHKIGLVHGDVRPANVFVTDQSRARLVGLGTKRLGDSAMSTERGRYAAPELATMPAPTPASDVYSLALTMLETLTGEVPFAADSTAVTLANRAGRLLPVPAEIGPIAVPIEKAGRPETADRSSALEFGQALAQLAARMPPPKPIEALSGESFRESITRTLEAVVVKQPAVPKVSAIDPEEPAVTAIPIEPPAAPQVEERGRYWWVRTVASVLAVVISGVLVWQALSIPSHQVPNLVGVAEGEARNQLALYKWAILIRAERSDDVALGDVIRTEPSPGTTLSEGSEIILVVSEGATLSVLPDIVGLTRDDALAALAAEGLLSVETATASEIVPAGVVVSWMVAAQPDLKAGSEVLKGTKVDIVISSGSALVEVPNLIGLSEEDVLVILGELQFVGQRNEDIEDPDAAAGSLVAQTPAPGERLARGSTVVYSLAPGAP